MAPEAPQKDPDEEDNDDLPHRNGREPGKDPKQDGGDMAGDEVDDEEEEEEEPKLKYAPLTRNLSSLYRNGDATSSFLVGGDKMVVGTHNGNIHVLSLPAFQSIRVYHAHSASISCVSISPYPPPPPNAKPEGIQRINNHSTPTKPPSSLPSSGASPRSPKSAPPVPVTPSNSIYIATSSIDGNVCVASLVDPKDVTLRNFGRPVQSVALSMDFRNDRSYLSGGLAGSLVLTTGGRAGTSENSSTNPVGGAAAAASNWLGTIGLGSNTGKDTVLHSGEGAISTIKWSLSGRYVVWVNEQGIKIMRSNLLLESAESGLEWKRINHIDRPNRPGWEEMASVWKARAEWIDQDSLEADEDLNLDRKESHASSETTSLMQRTRKPARIEKFVVGWGGTVWIINVHPGGIGTGKEAGERTAGRAEVSTILRTDSIISGISLYTPSLLVVLAYVTPDDSEGDKAPSTPRRGVQHRHNALEPELRLIDIDTKEEVCADTLTVSRYESLSAFDYHLGVLPASRKPAAAAQRGALEAFGTGLWDATMYPTRIFSASASMLTPSMLTSGSGEKRPGGSRAPSGSGVSSGIVGQIKEQQSVAFTEGMKIFIQSPYDCVVAVKRDLSDRLSWLEKHAQYQQAWELIDEHPESVASSSTNERPESPSRTPTGSSTLADFFGDNSSQSTLPNMQASNSAPEKEKRRIGEMWLEQLIKSNDWDTAGQICGKVLGKSSRWEHWIWTFTRNGHVESITPYIPLDTTPPLPSLVYEVVLGHYVSRDRHRFKELLDIWSADLFDPTTITTAIDDQLQSEDMVDESEDWRILTDCLAKLLLAGGKYREALRCYIRLQDADAAMGLIKDYHLLDSVADDIPGLILLRVSKSQQQNAPIDELKPLTAEPIALLVKEALHGIVQPETVVSQLEEGKYFIYLYFYFRVLWRGDETSSSTDKAAVITSEGRSIVDQFADTALELFADYDRPLLMEFLHASTYYSFSKATAVCEKRRYIPELVYLLSKTGEMKRALFLIIDELKDVTQAINFAKDQKDPGLWDDLLDYSMDKPQFIRGLLSEVGTAINPITLVKRIPSGLEIEGLRDGLIKMIREYDIQSSISQGVARVLQGEVAVSMNILRRGRNRGVKFDLLDGRPKSRGHGQNKPNDDEEPAKKALPEKEQPGHCAGCGRVIMDEDNETLVGFACGHVYHLSHLDGPPDGESLDNEGHELGESTSFTRSVGLKVTHAFLLKEKIGKGCRICAHKRAEE